MRISVTDLFSVFSMLIYSGLAPCTSTLYIYPIRQSLGISVSVVVLVRHHLTVQLTTHFSLHVLLVPALSAKLTVYPPFLFWVISKKPDLFVTKCTEVQFSVKFCFRLTVTLSAENYSSIHIPLPLRLFLFPIQVD